MVVRVLVLPDQYRQLSLGVVFVIVFDIVGVVFVIVIFVWFFKFNNVA